MAKLKNGWKSVCQDCKWVFKFDEGQQRNAAEAFYHARQTGHAVKLHEFYNYLENIYLVTPVQIEDVE